MVVTEAHWLPTDEELAVQEVPLSAPALKAAANHLGQYCKDPNNEFMLCSDEYRDPRKCLNEGKDVTKCTLEFFYKVKDNCYDVFEKYANCLDKSHFKMELQACRKTQEQFDNCMLDKMNIKRPHFGHYCRVQEHDAKRPPVPPPAKMVFHDVPKGKEDGAPPALPPKYGLRFWWWR